MEHPHIDIVLPTYQAEPSEAERFYPSEAKKIADVVIADELNDQVYDEEDAKIWSMNISDKVREALHEKLIATRYKIVVQTTVAQLQDQGIRIASRCLWDPTNDNYVATSYSNQTLFCSVMIFALYTD